MPQSSMLGCDTRPQATTSPLANDDVERFETGVVR